VEWKNEGGWVAKMVKVACVVKVASTHHEERVVVDPRVRAYVQGVTCERVI
jgi:hypothetical protein